MKNGLLALTISAVFALLGLPTLNAQCSGGGCSGSGSSAGGCPSGGCGGKSVGRVDRKPGGAARGVTIDPAKVPSWNRPSTEAVENAAAEERPIVVYFPSENASETEVYGEELAELSKTDAVFIKMGYTADREDSPWDVNTVVPTSKLLSANPALAYDVPVGKDAVIVCDWHGNEYFRTDANIKASKLAAMLQKVSDEVEDANDKLNKQLERANEAATEGDRKKAIKYLLKNFKEDVVGLAAQEESIRLYHTIMDEARKEIEEFVANGNTDALKDLASELKKTDVENEIDEALEKLS